MADKHISSELKMLDGAFKRLTTDNLKAMQLLNEQVKALQSIGQQTEYICQALLASHNQCCTAYSVLIALQKKSNK